MKEDNANEIILYQPDDTLTLDVRVEDESVGLTQAQIVELFASSKANISEHLKHIFESGELLKDATVRKFRTVRQEGNRSVTRTLEFFNLDVIISVGYRVNTIRGIQFRQWANKVLKDYLLRGYSVNQRLMALEDRIDRRLSDHDRHLFELDEKVDFFVAHHYNQRKVFSSMGRYLTRTHLLPIESKRRNIGLWLSTIILMILCLCSCPNVRRVLRLIFMTGRFPSSSVRMWKNTTNSILVLPSINIPKLTTAS